MDKNIFAEAIEEYKFQIEYEKKLNTTTRNNNTGIELERAGYIAEAVHYYEENIKLGYPATHSYDRLIKIYLKQKKISDAIRVLEKYISVFTKENERRLLMAIESNPEIEVELKEGMELNKKVWAYSDIHHRDMIVFNPYPMFWYIEKLNKLKNK